MKEREKLASTGKARSEALRIRKVEQLARFFGQDLWQGNLSEMREDGKPQRLEDASDSTGGRLGLD